MKIGDLVSCPVNLETGEMFCNVKTLAIVVFIYDNEPKIEVAYLGEKSLLGATAAWFTEELDMVNEG
tara:strand:- start:746 stop:946 length:201 start_codon:yes stop_codon:yes gene_type:complete